MNKYFGTDGFRGEAGVELTAEHAFKIGRFLGRYLIKDADANKKSKPRVIIGKDTRLSGYMLECALASGLAASGANVYLAHVITTPGLTHLTASNGFDLGVMITASHNPFYDNGIKVIDRYGEKIDYKTAGLIEEYIDSILDTLPFAKGEQIGKIHDYSEGREIYLKNLISLSSSSLEGLRIGLDSANGAAYDVSRSVFESLGAKVYAIGKKPDGTNINKGCGSTHTDNLVKLVTEKKLDVTLGGEQSGHIIMRNYATTGDGLLTAIILACEIKERGERLGKLTDRLIVYPQESSAFRVKDKSLVMKDDEVADLIKKLKAELLPYGGRLIVRESGTEPKVRIMAEAESPELCKKCVNDFYNLLVKRGYLDE